MRATGSARSSPLAFPVALADSSAVVTRVRATTARRRSSAAGPSSVTNAATSQEDMRIRAAPTFTVVIERPRDGGVAISCSQIFSRQDSKSRAGSISFFDDEGSAALSAGESDDFSNGRGAETAGASDLFGRTMGEVLR